MDRKHPLELPLERLAEICVRHKVVELSLFGSAARGELRDDGDFDLLVVFDADARVGLFQLVRLRNELADAFGRDVDVVPKDGLKPALRAEVLAEARPLYAA